MPDLNAQLANKSRIRQDAVVNVMQIVAAPAKRQDGLIGINGPERRSANVIDRWAEQGISPIIVYPRRGRLWNRFAESGSLVLDWEIGSKWAIYKSVRLARWLVKNRVDVVHTQGPASLDLIAGIACRMTGVPLVVTRPVMIEDMTTYPRWLLRIYQTVDRIGMSLASVVVAISDQGMRRLTATNPNLTKKLRLVRNGVELTRFTPKPALNGNSGEFVVGMVAQLTPQKSWPDFLSVVHLLHSKGVPVRGLIVGDGPLRFELQRLAAEYRIADLVEFSGFQSDVRPWLERMDVFLFTSSWEGLSVAVIEAMAMGLPIVATDVAAIREQVHEGLNGYVRPYGDVLGMADACHTLWCNPHLRVSFGSESTRIANNQYSEERMVSGYSDVYKSCL